MKLWLDDEREAPQGWLRVTRADTALRLIRQGNVTEASLDHDLGESETGYWLLSQVESDIALGAKYPVPAFNVHSANPVGHTNMKRAIASIERMGA